MKRTMIGMMFVAAACWALSTPAAAQGRGAGAGMGAGHAAGSIGSSGNSHDMGTPSNSGASSSNAGSNAAGPKTAGELLTQNTQLATKLSNLLPKGSDLQAAASGYKNLGQFVAAVHVSDNLRIPFNQLKCTELATPDACPSPLTQPSRSTSLGGAIQTLKPTMTSSESKAAAKQAQKQASSDVNETPS